MVHWVFGVLCVLRGVLAVALLLEKNRLKILERDRDRCLGGSGGANCGLLPSPVGSGRLE